MPRAVNEALRRSKPFRTIGEEAMVALSATAVRVGAVFEEALRRDGVTGTQYNALRILAGGPRRGYPRSAIITRLMFPHPDATRLIDRLAKRGLVARDRSAEDGRVVLHRITPAGRRTLRHLEPVLDAMHAQVVDVLGEAAAQDLILSCDALLRAAAAGRLAADGSRPGAGAA